MTEVQWARVVQPATGAGWWHRMRDVAIPMCGVFFRWEDQLDRTTTAGEEPDDAICPRCHTGSQWEYES